jgi:hypothetical protein
MHAGFPELEIIRNTLLAQRLLAVMSERHESVLALDQDLSFISNLLLFRRVNAQLPFIA